MSRSKTLLAFAGGILIGTIGGLLLAPKKGSATRKKLMQAGSDLADDFKNKVSELKENIADRFEASEDENKSSLKKAHRKLA
jgi:gas vesicle protein